MSYELEITPLLGREESFGTITKSQLVEICDALVAKYTEQAEKLLEYIQQHPFLDQEGNTLPVPWGKRDEYISIALSAREQKALGVSQKIISVATLRQFMWPTHTKSIRTVFADVWADIRYPRRKQYALHLLVSRQRHNRSAWDRLIEKFSALHDDAVLKEHIMGMADLKETINANPNEKFVVGLAAAKSLNRLLSEIASLEKPSESVFMGTLQILEGMTNPCRQGEWQAHLYRRAVLDDLPFREDTRIRKPPPGKII